ncbi:uncharacterized protein LOC129226733 [Uloborus diversus]|uniref:uncharacterized protein LOC129226733 n=1 Tax=Uloborus diversus TaxID=327109 RepID=UPI002409B078|nr:uncharacterized protein LOC129226733 [Uloborus diversus]
MKTIKDYQDYAEAYMDGQARDYYNSAAHHMLTLKDNEDAFSRYVIRPRVLRNVAYRNMSLTVFGQSLKMPIGVSPVAFQRMAHPDGEMGTSRAVARHGGIMILSMLATTGVDELSNSSPLDSVHWLQVYITRNREITKNIIQKAEKVGFKAIVVTVDSPVNGMWGVNMGRNLSLPPHLSLPNLLIPDVGGNMRVGIQQELLDPALTWKDIQWIQTFTGLPIVVKGVLTAEDAILAVENGASGILVSNHGGRQLDTVPATLDALPEIVQAVKGQAEVFLDGGVRSGMDVFKALSLGARAVFFGRPAIWGLVHSGQNGVRNVLRIMENELDQTMALSGVSTLQDIDGTHVVRKQSLSYPLERKISEEL